MRVDVFTIFPAYLEGPLSSSLLGRARERGLLDVRVHDPRERTTDPHRSVDDTPFGGGAGMVMTPEPLFAAVEAVEPPRPLLLLSAAGTRFDQRMAERLATRDGFSLVCGRYEGVDQRVADHLCDDEISVGDYVLAGGEAAALVVIEAVARLVPGVMGNTESGDDESFGSGLLEYPQYTRPADPRSPPRPPWAPGPDGGRAAAARRVPGGTSRPVASGLLPSEPTPSRRRTMNATDLVDRANLRDDIPDFAPGDTLKVHVRVVEGNRERVQVFQGVVIRRKGSGARETFTVRKVSFGVGVERTFPVHSPIIARIEVMSRGDVRRAKLYYLRDRIGKAAKIRERRA